MLFVSVAALLCIATAYVLRPNLLDHGSVVVTGLNGINVVVGFVLFIAATALIGPGFGLPFLAALVIFETGQVLAYRMLGHDGARFRLIPLFNNTPISSRLLVRESDEFFVSILGAAFCLGPIALAATIAAMLGQVAPSLSQSFWVFAITGGAVNFVLLLPFNSLPGGRCINAAVVSFWPALAPAMAAFMAAAMFTASLRTGSVTLMVVAAFGAHSVLFHSRTEREQMHPGAGLIAMAAYTFTMAAHFSIGRFLFEAYF